MMLLVFPSVSSEKIDVGERRASASVGVGLRQACLSVFIFYFAAALLNGRALHEKASNRPYGPTRDVWMAATAPMAWVSTSFGLDRFRLFFEGILEDEP